MISTTQPVLSKVEMHDKLQKVLSSLIKQPQLILFLHYLH